MSCRGLCRDGILGLLSSGIFSIILPTAAEGLLLTLVGRGGRGEFWMLFVPQNVLDLRPKLSLSPSLVSEFDFFKPLNTFNISIVLLLKLPCNIYALESKQPSTKKLIHFYKCPQYSLALNSWCNYMIHYTNHINKHLSTHECWLSIIEFASCFYFSNRFPLWVRAGLSQF